MIKLIIMFLILTYVSYSDYPNKNTSSYYYLKTSDIFKEFDGLYLYLFGSKYKFFLQTMSGDNTFEEPIAIGKWRNIDSNIIELKDNLYGLIYKLEISEGGVRFIDSPSFVNSKFLEEIWFVDFVTEDQDAFEDIIQSDGGSEYSNEEYNKIKTKKNLNTITPGKYSIKNVRANLPLDEVEIRLESDLTFSYWFRGNIFLKGTYIVKRGIILFKFNNVQFEAKLISNSSFYYIYTLFLSSPELSDHTFQLKDTTNEKK